MTPSFSIRRLGDANQVSPLGLGTRPGDFRADYVEDDEHVLFGIDFRGGSAVIDSQDVGAFEKAGPRERIYFDPKKTHAAIVTCGGLCPGLNDVIRAIVMTLWQYGVRRVTGFRFGYAGMLPDTTERPLPLDPKAVDDIHRYGGSILGSARGHGERTGEIVDTLVRHDVDMLFTIGGDGTQRGSLKLADEIAKRRLEIAVVGIPKTIDNDLSYVERSFGFETAVSEAVHAVEAAATEARAAADGVGLVKLMGRESGFIATHAALASNAADFVLIPEVPFDIGGEHGFLRHLERCLDHKKNATVVVAEGAGQKYVRLEGTDASGNRKLGDIGTFLRDEIGDHFKAKGRNVQIKYIDPSYMIRSHRANPADSIYCARLGANAVHAAMSGRTACLVGSVNHRLVHVPIFDASDRRNCVDPEGPLWRDVVAATGMPALMVTGGAASLRPRP